MECERCGAKPRFKDSSVSFDYCVQCGKDLCPKCMTKGCCGSKPAESGMCQEEYVVSMSPHQRYRNDVQFHALVDMVESMIRECRYTPTELREAVILAAIHHENKNPSPVLTMIRQSHVGLLQEELNLQRGDINKKIDPMSSLDDLG